MSGLCDRINARAANFPHILNPHVNIEAYAAKGREAGGASELLYRPSLDGEFSGIGYDGDIFC